MTAVTVSRPRPVGRLRWWREVLYILAFYSVYTFIRNRGVATDSVAEARRNALDVVDLERRLGTYWEEAIQDRFLDWTPFIQFWNIFYGTAHFVVTVFALVYLFRRMAYRYPLWRNTLACTTGLALVGFAFYPLMPPRLLDPGFGFVDTLRDVGGLWSFDSGAVAKVSNQYAAMPSLHFAWSTWCALVLYPAARRPWVRLVVLAYPALTLFAIVVTANHYWLDAAGGAATLGAGFLLGRALTRALEARGRQPLPETVDDLPDDPEAHLAAGASAAEAEAETAGAEAEADTATDGAEIPDGAPEQPRSPTPDGAPEQPRSPTPDGAPEHPRSPTPDGAPEQPRSPTPDGAPELADIPAPAAAVTPVVGAVDTNGHTADGDATTGPPPATPPAEPSRAAEH